ncbi:MAG: DUF3880 domain-containing protein [Burkholderiales bacterium]|nr:DUF3880 domain-containing protein [Burkholderiales bacterium]
MVNNYEINGKEPLNNLFIGLEKKLTIQELSYIDKWNEAIKSQLPLCNIKDETLYLEDNLGFSLREVIFQMFGRLSLPPIIINSKEGDVTTRLAKKIELLQNKEQYLSHNKTSPKLKIAIIADEFTFSAFSYEASILQLHPEFYQNQLEIFRPDFVLIESAWLGLDKLWKGRMSIVGNKIFKLMKYCHNKNIICIYWGKEDPVSFRHFLPIAKYSDIVFTTDFDCIDTYKKELRHENVYLLPFAAQTAVHNPIEIYERQDKFFFAGAYYREYKVRKQDFDNIMQNILDYKIVDIYDRNYNSAKRSSKSFPKNYASYVVGKLDFSDIQKAYKGYKYAMNVNTVKYSSSMCSRRVFELMASNTLVVSNYSSALHNLLKVGFLSSDNKIKLNHYLAKICNDEDFANKIKLYCLRQVLAEHTYFDRIAFIKSVIGGVEYKPDLPHVAIFAVVRSVYDFIDVRFKCYLQSYTKSTLYILNYSNFQFNSDDKKIKEYTNIGNLMNDIVKLSNSFITYFSSEDYYGENYLLDLILATKYSNACGIGKAAYFVSNDKETYQIQDQYYKYKYVDKLYFRRGIFSLNNVVDINILSKWLKSPDSAYLSKASLLSIDEFNYCQNGVYYYFNASLKPLLRDLRLHEIL